MIEKKMRELASRKIPIVREVHSKKDLKEMFRDNRFKLDKKIRATSTESDSMSRDLERRGFRFVGSTICYAFMQGTGMINDHLIDCFRYDQL